MTDSLGANPPTAEFALVAQLLKGIQTEIQGSREDIRALGQRVDTLEENSKSAQQSGSSEETSSSGLSQTISETQQRSLGSEAVASGPGEHEVALTSVTEKEQAGESHECEEPAEDENNPGEGVDEEVDSDSENEISVQQREMQASIGERLDDARKFLDDTLADQEEEELSTEDIKNLYVKESARIGIAAARNLCTNMKVLKDEKTEKEWRCAVDFVELLVITLVELMEFYVQS